MIADADVAIGPRRGEDQMALLRQREISAKQAARIKPTTERSI